MTCPVCGKEPPCTHGWNSAAVLTKDDQSPGESVSGRGNSGSGSAYDHNWRREITSRVQQHRARRRRTADDDAALEFDFPPQEALIVTEEPVTRERMYRHLAVDDLAADLADAAIPQAHDPGPGESPKIIRFPRSLAATAADPLIDPQLMSEMREPVQEVAPRIMDAPEHDALVSETALPSYHVEPMQAEQMELLPSFEDIRLEPGHARAEIDTDVIPRPAALQQRLIAGVVDLAVVVSAAALFYFTFVRLAEDDPHSRLALLSALVVSTALWILFQYLFLVHGAGTPGMRFAQLELSTFEGKPVSAQARRLRAMASTLSAVSIGLGYAWALVDEDRLGWHDRITGTLVHSKSEVVPHSREIWTDFITGI